MILRQATVSLWVTLVAAAALCLQLGYSSASSSAAGMIVRIRFADGSMEKVLVPQGAEDTMTLSDILNPFDIRQEDCSISVGPVIVNDMVASPLSGLGVQHGSLITIQSSSTATTKPTESRFAQLKVTHDRSWDPYPDLAKDYEHALLKTKTRRSSQKGMSYADLARLQSSLHIVEPQTEGSLQRVYMCRISAERFQANGSVSKKDASKRQARVGLLLGTIQRERVELTKRKARTSLSSQTADSEFCTVAKVQAVWEPPGQTTTLNNQNNIVYDADVAQQLLQTNPRVLAVAEHLGLVPVGWIFSHTDTRSGDALPVFGLDVQTGAMLQIAQMQSRGRAEGAHFVTLSMDATTGATEAFQLSAVGVQMVHEGILVTTKGESKRHVPTKHVVLVDGKETKVLDSVLCLINAAMLSHVGAYAGKTATSSVNVKKSNGLTTKAKKALAAALAEDDDDHKLLEQLCDFNALVALDQSLSKDDSAELCQLVRKWSRGQKQGTTIGSKLKMQLRSILETF